MLVLGIETSCDETSVALVNDKEVISLVTQTQLEHIEYGGVVPEIASRKHIELIDKIYQKAIEEASIGLEEVDAIAVTNGPGLLGSLLVGVMFAKGLAQPLKKPLVGINHIYSHIQSAFIEYDVQLPYVVLVVSGGHTALFYTQDNLNFKMLGSTRDDAAGEAFDKGAKLLGLGYPGGPIIDKLAKEYKISENGNEDEINFPIGLKQKESLDFSFSGLKTSLLYFLKKNKNYDINKIAYYYQKAIVDSLLYKLKNAALSVNTKNLVIVGGVSANSYFRKKLKEEFVNYNIYMPSLKYCTDNAAMVAKAAINCSNLWLENWNKEYTLESYANIDISKIFF